MGAEHTLYTDGLNLALNDYLNGLGLDISVHEWFDLDVPNTTLPPNLIGGFLEG